MKLKKGVNKAFLSAAVASAAIGTAGCVYDPEDVQNEAEQQFKEQGYSIVSEGAYFAPSRGDMNMEYVLEKDGKTYDATYSCINNASWTCHFKKLSPR